jgi:DNA-binding beta-propeller fold protein YncE
MPTPPRFVPTEINGVTAMDGRPGPANPARPTVTSTVPANAGPLFYDVASNFAYTITRANAYDWSGQLVGHIDATAVGGQAARIAPSPNGQQLFVDGHVYSPQGRWLRWVGGWAAKWSADSKSLCVMSGVITGEGVRYLDIESPANVIRRVASLPPGGMDWGNGIALCNPADGLVVVEFSNNTRVGAYSIVHTEKSVTVESFACQEHGPCPSEDMVPSPDGKTLAVTDTAYGWISLLDVTTGKATPTVFNGTPRIFLDATTLLASSDTFRLFNVVLINTATDRDLWEGEQVNFEQAYGTTGDKVAFSTSYRSLTGPRVAELDVLTVDRTGDPGNQANIRPEPLALVWPH